MLWNLKYNEPESVMCLDNFAFGGGGGCSEKSDQLYFFDQLFLHRNL